MDQAQQFQGAIIGVPLAIGFLILLALTILLPVYVATISSRIGKLLLEVKAHGQLLKQVQQISANSGKDVAEQLQVSNELTRQLLRAYGHEPEV